MQPYGGGRDSTGGKSYEAEPTANASIPAVPAAATAPYFLDVPSYGITHSLLLPEATGLGSRPAALPQRT
ncbi:MAG: hypothetical protein WBM24_00665 [Candidatus Sulfotelmatobacter sp.]